MGKASRQSSPQGGRGRGDPIRQDEPDRSSGFPLAEAWYVTEGRKGEQLLARRDVAAARQVFEGILARLDGAPTFARAVTLGQLGSCLHLDGQIGAGSARLREGMGIADRLVPTNEVTALRASLFSGLGRAMLADGRPTDAKAAHEAALALAERLDDPRARGLELSHLAALDLAEGQAGRALARYARAVTLFLKADDPALEALTRHRLAALLQHAGHTGEAEQNYLQAARIREARGDLAAAAGTWTALGELKEQAGDARAAEACYRKAVDASLKLGSLDPLADAVARLAGALQHQPQRLGEARQLAQQALSIARRLDPVGEPVWRIHGLLAEIDGREADEVAVDGHRRESLRAQAHGHRQLSSLAPRILAAKAQLGKTPRFGRAVILGGLGRCLLAAGEVELAAEHLLESLQVSQALQDQSDEMKGLQSALCLQLGEVLIGSDRHVEAEEMLDKALALAQEIRDFLGQGMAHCHRAALAHRRGMALEAQGHARAALAVFRQLRSPELDAFALDRLAPLCPLQPLVDTAETEAPSAPRSLIAEPGFEIITLDDASVEYAFEPDLLLDGRRERRVVRVVDAPESADAAGVLGAAGSVTMLPDEACPVLVPGSRSYVDEDGNAHFALPAAEPVLERRPGCIVMRRNLREVVVEGAGPVLWKLVRALDGSATVRGILSAMRVEDQDPARRLLAALASSGVLDVSGRPYGRYIHLATKKGVLPGGRLQDEQVRRLVGDGGYRSHDNAPRLPLGTGLPEGLRAFHALTRTRRSRRDYSGRPVSRADFDALLGTACGVTATLPWVGHDVKLRAYPSSGALYAVEIYPVLWRVEGLAPGVYHFLANENALEAVRTGVDMDQLMLAALPVEREMVAAAAGMICLVGHFPRHEHKYGQGGYRMLVAEAGHVSQTLVLAATALGLAARPFGGVFDDLVNQDLGLDDEQEQFLLAVLVGHAGGEDSALPSAAR